MYRTAEKDYLRTCKVDIDYVKNNSEMHYQELSTNDDIREDSTLSIILWFNMWHTIIFD